MPKRILVIAPTEKAVDHLLDLFLLTRELIPFKITRMGRSNTREDLNEQFCVKLSHKAEKEKGYRIEETQAAIGQA